MKNILNLILKFLIASLKIIDTTTEHEYVILNQYYND
jgi:hypothetical protein